MRARQLDKSIKAKHTNSASVTLCHNLIQANGSSLKIIRENNL